MKLNNKVFLVTGGEGLIGKSIINNINKNEGIAISLDIKIIEIIRIFISFI